MHNYVEACLNLEVFIQNDHKIEPASRVFASISSIVEWCEDRIHVFDFKNISRISILWKVGWPFTPNAWTPRIAQFLEGVFP